MHFGKAKLISNMRAERIFDGQFPCNQSGSFDRQSARLIDRRQFCFFGFRHVDEGLLFAKNVGAFDVGLRTDRNILASRHRHCACGKPSGPGQ